MLKQANLDTYQDGKVNSGSFDDIQYNGYNDTISVVKLEIFMDKDKFSFAVITHALLNTHRITQKWHNRIKHYGLFIPRNLDLH